MFHALKILSFLNPSINAKHPAKSERPDLRPALPGDEVYTPSPRRSEVWRANLGSLSEPRHEQNLSANPKRTAKAFAVNSDATGTKKVQ
jgi:hypothetical protein